MIASLTGTVEHGQPGEVIIHVGGVGYQVFVSLTTFSELPPSGEEARVRINTVVREDEISLYGFASQAEEWLFTLLRGVSGVGPKLALKILSGLEPVRLRDALSSGDAAMLTTISGVGKKVAQRLIVELRDKAGAVEGLEPPRPSAAGSAGAAPSEAMEALVALGYQPRTARDAVDAALTVESSTDSKTGQSTQQLVREALKRLAPKK